MGSALQDSPGEAETGEAWQYKSLKKEEALQQPDTATGLPLRSEAPTERPAFSGPEPLTQNVDASARSLALSTAQSPLSALGSAACQPPRCTEADEGQEDTPQNEFARHQSSDRLRGQDTQATPQQPETSQGATAQDPLTLIAAPDILHKAEEPYICPAGGADAKEAELGPCKSGTAATQSAGGTLPAEDTPGTAGHQAGNIGAEETSAHSLPTSKYHGVFWSRDDGKWMARLSNQRLQEFLGVFDLEEDAARAYDKAAMRTLGRELQLNFPEEAGNARRRRGLATYDSDPEISADSENGNSPQDVDEEIAPRRKANDKERKKPTRRKRPRLVPPHSRSSRYRGVYWEPKGSKWYSSISSNHKQIHLGSFNTEEEAAQAFDQEAIRLRGPGTFTNFPSDTYVLGDADSDGEGGKKPPTQKRPPNGIRRRVSKKRSEDGEEEEEEKEKEKETASRRPEKDDQAANALLSLGSSLPRRNGKAKPAVAPKGRPMPPLSIEPPVTLRGQKRKRVGSQVPANQHHSDGVGRARSAFTGVYQQSRGNGWFASICVDKSMRYLGTFPTEEDAARAFDQEAIRLRGTGIELNLPHEAEDFMQRLREEEEAAEAAGKMPQHKRGPAPVVTAGPDFEELPSRLPSHRHGGNAMDDEMQDEPRIVQQRRRGSERNQGNRRRSFNWDFQGVSSESEEELPSWDGRRSRSTTRRTKRTDSTQAPVANATQTAEAAPAPLLNPKQAFGSYLSMLGPAVSTLAAIGGFPATSFPLAHIPGSASIQGSLPQQPSAVARPSASYVNPGSLQALGPAFNMGYAWPPRGHQSFQPLGAQPVIRPSPRSQPRAQRGIKGTPLSLGAAAMESSKNGQSSLQGRAPHDQLAVRENRNHLVGFQPGLSSQPTFANGPTPGAFEQTTSFHPGLHLSNPSYNHSYPPQPAAPGGPGLANSKQGIRNGATEVDANGVIGTDEGSTQPLGGMQRPGEAKASIGVS